jgi:hypothetical protein
MCWPDKQVGIIELSKIHDNVRNLLPRHSGEGRNPVDPTSPALRDKTQLHFEQQRWIPAFAGMTVVTKVV